jgi:hypothetical protein
LALLLVLLILLFHYFHGIDLVEPKLPHSDVTPHMTCHAIGRAIGIGTLVVIFLILQQPPHRLGWADTLQVFRRQFHNIIILADVIAFCV